MKDKRRVLHVGDLNGAMTDLNQAISIDPKRAEAYYFCGYVLIAKKDFAAASTDFDRALELRPSFAWDQQGRGMKSKRKHDQITQFSSIRKIVSSWVWVMCRSCCCDKAPADLFDQEESVWQ